jgi:hypothetical protein
MQRPSGLHQVVIVGFRLVTLRSKDALQAAE